METRRDPRQFLFFIILLLLINSPEPQTPAYSTRSRYDELLEREWHHLHVLNRTRWGDFGKFGSEGAGYLNITGLREEDHFAWEVLGDVKERVRERTKEALGEGADELLHGKEGKKAIVYRNLTGHVLGDWVRSPLSRVRHPADLNISHVLPDNPFPLGELDRNLTGTGGPVRIHFFELEGKARTDANRTVSEVQAKVVIGDDESWGDNWWEFLVNGVHYPEHGAAVLTTTSER